MPFSSILDVAIGVAFVYLFFSLVCSGVNEGIAAVFSLRARNLLAGIESLFSDGELEKGRSFVEAIYNHGLIRGLFKDPANKKSGAVGSGAEKVKHTFGTNILPSYIPSRTFAIALLDLLMPSGSAGVPAPAVQPGQQIAQNPGNPPGRTLSGLSTSIDALPEGPAKKALQSLAANTVKDIAEFQQKVENWYDDSMDRAAGWYKRRAQWILLALGFVVAVSLNVDSIHVARTLWVDPVARQATVTVAQDYVRDHPVKSRETTDNEKEAPTTKTIEQEAEELEDVGKSLPIPIGWGQNALQKFQDSRNDPVALLLWLSGWLITALALSLGAPFWFDTLNKFMMARSSVKPKND
jgi:hypothetical protein